MSGVDSVWPIPEHRGLFRTFASLPSSSEAYAAFDAKYGPVGWGSDAERAVEHHAFRLAVGIFDVVLGHALIDAVGDLGLSVEAVMTASGRFVPAYVYVVADGMPGLPGALVRADTPAAGMAQAFLAELINAELADHSVRLDLVPNEDADGVGISPAFVAQNVLGAMWVQLVLALEGRREFRVCPVCGEWWDASRARSHKAVCSDNCRAKQSYVRRKAAGSAARV